MVSSTFLAPVASIALVLSSLTGAFVITPNMADKVSPALHPRPILPRDGANPTAQLLEIVPNASTCNGAPYPNECATAADAVQPIIASFAKYQISTVQEQVALLSWMAYESGEFKYDMNHFPAPGRPGQGTRAMMMPNFVAEYAATLPEVTSKVNVQNAAPADILAAVIATGNDWGGAAWFYSTNCSDDVKNAVRTQGRAGWESFVQSCVQTTLNDQRVAYWQNAARALGWSPS